MWGRLIGLGKAVFTLILFSLKNFPTSSLNSEPTSTVRACYCVVWTNLMD